MSDNHLVVKDISQISSSINLEDEILRLKKEMNAVILAHYYQADDLQDIADFIGDSLDLSRKAAETKADVIVFLGVKFMAEVAKILSPDKLVLLPDLEAGCSLEESCPPNKFRKLKEEYPDHIVLSYINCSAEIKALSDIIVTSSNAEKIIRQIPIDKKIIFAPDKHLGSYLIKKTGRDMLLWNGSCIVHEQFSEKELIKLKIAHPQAKVIAHPECPEQILSYADHIGSTSSLLKYTKDNPNGEFIVLTEPGIIHQMEKVSAGSKFYPVDAVNNKEGGDCTYCNNCPFMKLNNMEKLYLAMINKSPKIELDSFVVSRAKLALDKMLMMS